MRSLVALLFSCAVWLRHFAYRWRIFKEKSANIPVISVGSIQIGGSGKTPICIYLAGLLTDNEIKFGFVSRGYKSIAEKLKTPKLLDKIDTYFFGDEPCLIHSYFPKAPFAVGKKRVLGVELIEKQGAKLALCDDGFQHLQLKKDLQIVALDAQDPFSGNAFFPKGRLRDFPTHLKQADLIFAFGQNDQLKNKLKAFTKAAVIFAEKKMGGIFDRDQKLVNIKGKKLALFAGIANPQSFFDQFDRAKVVWSRPLKDHQKMTQKKLASLVKQAQLSKADALICTEKDWIKIKGFSVDLPIYFAKLRIEITEGEGLLLQKIQTVCGLEKKPTTGQYRKNHVKV